VKGDQAAAKSVAEFQAKELDITDKDLVKTLVTKAKSEAQNRSNSFKIELAALVDGAYSLIHSTYALEGDGVTVFFAWELWNFAFGSIKIFAENPETVAESQFGLPLENRAIWIDHPDLVKKIFAPAWVYMQEQAVKHAKTLDFMRSVNPLCPWNRKNLTRETLAYFVGVGLLSQIDSDGIVAHELDSYHVRGEWDGALQPSSVELFLRASPQTLLPEARVWRFWFVHQKILPRLTKLVKVVASAQVHSAAAERTGSLFTHDKTAQTDAAAVETTVIRQRMHYANVVNPMKTMPLDGLAILLH
jgi:hypothetical protein